MNKFVRIVWQTALLFAIYQGSLWVVRVTGIPVPANVLGILVLFCLLLSGVIKEEHVQEAATFFLKHLVFFFVPVAVALMNWGEVFYQYGWVLLAAIVVSALLPLAFVGRLAQYLQKRKDRCSH